METRHLHALVGTALLVVLPLASIALGSGHFAWTMYSASGEYRIDIRVKDAAGTWHSVAPTGLADRASRGTSRILVGADHFRRGPSLTVLRASLPAFAHFVCDERRGVEADVVLHERRDANDPEQTTSAHVVCR